MDRLSMQSCKPWLQLRATRCHAHRVESRNELGKPFRKLRIHGARLFVVAASLSGFAAQVTGAGCGCGDCAEASCTTCETCSATPRICGLGNGLLDVLDRASGRLESRLFRLRPTDCSCNSPSGSACDTISEGAGSSILTDASFEDTVIQSPARPSHSDSESWQPSPHGSSGRIESSPVPVPVPDPIASPPMSSPVPAPAPRAGNPFTDEARSQPNQVDQEAPAKIVYSLRSSSIPTLRNIKGDFAKVDVKPVPKHLLRGRVEKALDPQGVDQQMNVIQSEVIPAASLTPPVSSKTQFAR